MTDRREIGLNSILLINRHIQQDKDIYGTGSDRKLTAYINHLLKFNVQISKCQLLPAIDLFPGCSVSIKLKKKEGKRKISTNNNIV